ncbi:DUF3995 domain-containing protein [Streptomyces roseolus]|uniref:DUF3995 domain-containing protein n=1 Tax=Streptomyces roseolus TaxID=67358 RepID=UPI00379902D9
MGGLCLLGSALAGLLTRCDLRSTPATVTRWLGRCVSAVLLTRGNGLEVMLLTGIGPVDTAVGEEQRNWSLALWNPWFVAGGIAFGLAPSAWASSGKRSGRRTAHPAAGDGVPPRALRPPPALLGSVIGHGCPLHVNWPPCAVLPGRRRHRTASTTERFARHAAVPPGKSLIRSSPVRGPAHEPGSHALPKAISTPFWAGAKRRPRAVARPGTVQPRQSSSATTFSIGCGSTPRRYDHAFFPVFSSRTTSSPVPSFT